MLTLIQSLSARRAWIEIPGRSGPCRGRDVALRKESVDRNVLIVRKQCRGIVALRKESVDRNRNSQYSYFLFYGSLSARRAWIEIRT